MDAYERRCDAVLLAESVFSIRGRGLVIAGKMIQGRVRAGDKIICSDPVSAMKDQTIHSVELITTVRRQGLVGLLIKPDTNQDSELIQAIQFEGIRVMIANQE